MGSARSHHDTVAVTLAAATAATARYPVGAGAGLAGTG
jgi:hypothetical protein